MKKSLKISLISILTIFVVLFGGFAFYASDYYHADNVAKELLTETNSISKNGEYTILKPEYESGIGFIFYPGGKVEDVAYLPLLSKMQERGITCVMAKMPFNLAVMDANAADDVYEMFPEIKTWYIGGHSLGGAMASNYASKNMDKIDGVVLLGSYIYGDVSPEKTITIYGSEDKVLKKEKITYDTNVIEIKGGNHAGFGNYGAQDGDGVSTMSNEEQQDISVREIIKFMGLE